MNRRVLILSAGALLLTGAVATALLADSRARASRGVLVFFLGHTNLPSGRHAVFKLKNSNTGYHPFYLMWVQFKLWPADGSAASETRSEPFDNPQVTIESGESFQLRIADPKTHGRWRCTFYGMRSGKAPEWKSKLVRFLDRVGIYRRFPRRIDDLVYGSGMLSLRGPDITI